MSGVEATLQTKITRYLRSKGCYVIKTQAGPGVPRGCPDVLFFKEGFYGAIEVKASKTARFQPLQRETVAKLDDWSWARVCYPANWPEIRQELDVILL